MPLEWGEGNVGDALGKLVFDKLTAFGGTGNLKIPLMPPLSTIK